MKNSLCTLVGALALAAVVGTPSLAQRDKSKTPTGSDLNRLAGGMLDDLEVEELTVEDQALQHYQQGVALIQRGLQLEEKVAEAVEGPKRDKMRKRIDDSYAGAILELNQALTKHAELIDGYAALGWVYRRTAKWDEAIGVYDRALAMAPGFGAALEGRGEALLALNRPDEARQAYKQLAGADTKNAAALLEAMKFWVRRQEQAGTADPETLEQMTAFIEAQLG